MNSKRLFYVGYALLFASFGLFVWVFMVNPNTVFSLPRGIQPDRLLVAIDSTPTIVFLVGVGFLAAGQLKQWFEGREKAQEL